MPVVRANAVDIRYVESGRGEPVILLHGGQSDRHQFDIFSPLLGEGIRAIAYDQRDSPEQPCDQPYGMADHARDCAAFVAALGLRKAHLVGTSYGGAVAMRTAIDFPDRVAGLVLAATTPSWAMAEPVVGPTITEHDPAAIERFMMEMALSPEAIDSDPLLVAEYRAALRLRGPEAIERRMSVVRDHDCREWLGRIRSPTLVLHGEDDRLISARSAKWTAERIAGAELMLLPGSRHGLTLEHRQRTADLIRSFILRHPLGKGAVAPDTGPPGVG